MSKSSAQLLYRDQNRKTIAGTVIFSIPVFFYLVLFPDFLREKIWELVQWPEPAPVAIWIYLSLFTLTCQLAVLAAEQRSKSLCRTPASARTDMLPFITYLLFRTGFLVVYELFFRGLLLFTCLAFFTPAVALLLNLIFYTAAHLHCSKTEIIGCIPFGLANCLLTLQCHSVLAAIGLHLALSHVHDVHSLYFPNRTPLNQKP